MNLMLYRSAQISLTGVAFVDKVPPTLMTFTLAEIPACGLSYPVPKLLSFTRIRIPVRGLWLPIS